MRTLPLLLALAAAPAAAQTVPEAAPDCDSGVQSDMNACAARDAAEADDALNAAYAVAVARARGFDEGTGATLNEELLRRAQRLWIDYRDAACNAETEPFAGGSIAPMLLSFCVAGLSRERTGHLQTYAEQP